MDSHRIEVPERFGLAGAYITIKPRESYGMRNRVQGAGLVIRTNTVGATGEVTADVLERGLAVLGTAVLSWHGIVDGDGRPIPVSRAGFLHDDFDPDLGDWLVDAITAHYESQKRPAEDASAEGKPEAPPSETP